ncbi:hypothetical protein F2Q69_00058918 [Brassica cretica]|uniref:Mnd1 HTH domain-containing protein n=1 Tax=Brassica cretica TaxID=69181 RepID=A0A8S9RKP9_BRACR|nr:hypothetical protein F2Q69_00058918 [Brassica cretica]
MSSSPLSSPSLSFLRRLHHRLPCLCIVYVAVSSSSPLLSPCCLRRCLRVVSVVSIVTASHRSSISCLSIIFKEEKRKKMLQIFYDSQDFFLLKELEKMGPKKGVISQSVKDVIHSLVDDDLVSKDKVSIFVSSLVFMPQTLVGFYMLFNCFDYYANEVLLLKPSQLCRQSGPTYRKDSC